MTRSNTPKTTAKSATSDDPMILVINVYYAPNSFGGATIIAENTVRLMKAEHGLNLTVLTTMSDDRIVPYGVMRYEVDGVPVIAINMPRKLTAEQFYDHPKFDEIVREITAQLEPDAVHLHSVQTMGAGMIAGFRAMGIPVAVTVHDCWWICERQFMIKPNNVYCHQRKIDLNVCAHCVHDIAATRKRYDYLTSMLHSADKLYFPSEFQRALFVDNGFAESKCFVNKNGIVFPPSDYEKRPIKDPAIKVRFGFAGGPGPIKGFSLIKEAFARLDRDDYELVLVDGAQNLKTTWAHDFHMNVDGKVSIIPAYNQNTMDDFYGRIDVLLFPSQWKESFGLTVREALVRDVWVISTNGGGTIEDCVDGENSTIIPLSASVEDLLSAIQDCFDMPLATYVNPHKNDLQSIDSQAAELAGYLNRLI